MDFDILIVGAGFAGVASAYFLSDPARSGRKLKIALLEKESRVGCHASGRNAGMFRQAVAHAQTAAWIQQTKKYWQDWEGPGQGPRWFRQTGSFLLGSKDSLLSLQKNLRQAGGQAQLLRPGEFPEGTAQDLIEQLKGSSYEALLYTPDDGVVEVQEYLEELLQRVQSQGVEICFETELQSLEWQQDHWQIQHRQGTARAKLVINAAGAWAPQVAEHAGLLASQLPPMKSYRRHLLSTEALDPPLATNHWPIIWRIGEEVYFRPFGQGLMFSPGDESAHPPEAPAVDPQVKGLLRDKLAQTFPQITVSGDWKKIWACLRTKSKDGTMVLGPDLHHANFIWAAALGGHGLSASLGVGENIAATFFSKGRE